MKVQKFSKGEAIRFGWDVMKKNAWFFTRILMLYIVIAITFAALVELATKSGDTFLMISTIVISQVIQAMISMGFIKISLKLYDGQKAEFRDLFSCSPLLLKFVAGSLIYAVILYGMTFLMISPLLVMFNFMPKQPTQIILLFSFSIIVTILLLALISMIGMRLLLFGNIIVDKGIGPVQALKKSWDITKGSVINIFVFYVLILGINTLGILAIFVGLLFTAPATMIAIAFMYRKLSAQAEPAAA